MSLAAAAAAAAQAAQQGQMMSRVARPLRWHRPDTTGWTVIDLDDVVAYDPDPENNQIGQVVLYPTDPVNHPTDEDYLRIEFPLAGGNFVLTQTVPLDRRIRFYAPGPTNLVWIGGETRIDTEWTNEHYDVDDIAHYVAREGVQVAGDFRLIYIEGYRATGDTLIEGIDLMDGYNMVLVVQNSRIYVDCPQLPDAAASDGIYHHDPIQCWAGLHSMRVSGCTLVSPFQGQMFGDGSYPTRPVGMTWKHTEIRDTNYGYGRDHTPELVAARLINHVQNDRLVGPVILDNVYADPRPRKWGLSTDNLIEGDGSFWAGTGDVDEDGRRVWSHAQTYPSEGISDGNQIDPGPGLWQFGRPANGDFCKPHMAGLDYIPPANVDSEPYAVGGKFALNHLANRPVKRTAAEYPNGGTVTDRGWKVLSGPARVDEELSTTTAMDEHFTDLGVYELEYHATTEHGTAISVIEAHVIDPDVNWMPGVRRFDSGLGTWTAYEAGSSFAITNPTRAGGGVLRATKSSGGSFSVRPDYNVGSNLVPVYPGEEIFCAIDMRQVSGSARQGQLRVVYLTEGRGLVAEHPATLANITAFGTTHTFADTVPDGAAYAMLIARVFQGGSGEVFDFDNAHLGDVIPLNLFRGDRQCIAGVEAWAKISNPSNFNLSWNATDHVMELECTTASSIGVMSTADYGGSGSAFRRIPVTPGDTLDVTFSHRQTAGTAPTGLRPQVQFFTSGGSYISQVDPANVSPVSGWTRSTWQALVPATAQYARINAYVQGAPLGGVFQLADFDVRKTN